MPKNPHPDIGIGIGIDKHGPFDSPQQEVVLSVLRTNEVFQHLFGKFFRSHGLSEPQFNVLWILGRAKEPLPSLEVARRLLVVVPGITRLLDTLEKRNLVVRERSKTDRRVWLVSLTDAGRELLIEMSEPNMEMHNRLVGHLSPKECSQLILLLEKARAAIEV